MWALYHTKNKTKSSDTVLYYFLTIEIITMMRNDDHEERRRASSKYVVLHIRWVSTKYEVVSYEWSSELRAVHRFFEASNSPLIDLYYVQTSFIVYHFINSSQYYSYYYHWITHDSIMMSYIILPYRWVPLFLDGCWIKKQTDSYCP